MVAGVSLVPFPPFVFASDVSGRIERNGSQRQHILRGDMGCCCPFLKLTKISSGFFCTAKTCAFC